MSGRLTRRQWKQAVHQNSKLTRHQRNAATDLADMMRNDGTLCRKRRVLAHKLGGTSERTVDRLVRLLIDRHLLLRTKLGHEGQLPEYVAWDGSPSTAGISRRPSKKKPQSETTPRRKSETVSDPKSETDAVALSTPKSATEMSHQVLSKYGSVHAVPDLAPETRAHKPQSQPAFSSMRSSEPTPNRNGGNDERTHGVASESRPKREDPAWRCTLCRHLLHPDLAGRGLSAHPTCEAA